MLGKMVFGMAKVAHGAGPFARLEFLKTVDPDPAHVVQSGM
jgi:hypothetical protein